ncbi:META domain-containing protein [Chryseobacterium sp. T1]
MKNIFLAITAALVITSCTATSGAKVGTAQPSLVGTEWVLAEDVNSEQPTLSIVANKISGNAGCNNYFSNSFTSNPKLGDFVASNIGSTRKACINMSVENNFLNMLQEANKYIVTDTTLELYKDKILLLKFNKK